MAVIIPYYKRLSSHTNITPSNTINLFVEYYLTKDSERQKEIDFVFSTNFNEISIDKIYVIIHNDNEEERIQKIYSTKHLNQMIIIKINNLRPTYGELYSLIDEYSNDDDINILANSDIVFDKSIDKVRKLRKDEAIVLSRWNIKEYQYPFNGVLEGNPKNTQDVWIIRNKPHPILKKINFTTGLLRCDNRLAYILSREAHYKVFNPCLDIKTYHVHKSGVRNYSRQNMIPGIRGFVPACNWS